MNEELRTFIGCLAGNQDDINAVKKMAFDPAIERDQKFAIAFLQFCAEVHSLFENEPASVPIFRKSR